MVFGTMTVDRAIAPGNVEHSLLSKARPDASGVRFHPNMAEYYRAQIADLRTALSEDGRQREAAEIVRKLVDRIELSPVMRSGRKSLSVSLYGRLAGILAMATKAKAPLDESDAAMKVTKLVAGARNCLDLLLSTSIYPSFPAPIPVKAHQARLDFPRQYARRI